MTNQLHTYYIPESGGTVPIFAAMSRCPAKHFTCPEFLRRRKVCPSFASTLVYGGHARKKGVARSCLAYCPEMRMRYTLRVCVHQLEFAVALDEGPTDSHSTTDKIDVCPYFLHKILNFWKHSPSFFYWEVDRYGPWVAPRATCKCKAGSFKVLRQALK